MNKAFQGWLKLARLLAIFLAVANFSACDKLQLPGGTEGGGQPQASPEKKLAPMPKCEEAKAGGPEEVVRTLYLQYPFEGKKTIQIEPEEALRKFFDKRLTGLLTENLDCQNSSYEICALDWSIMYVAQDAQITDLRVCEMDPGQHTGNVQFRNFGEPQIVPYELVKTDAGWRISDIGGVADTLSGYFSGLAAAWEKAQVPETPQTSPQGTQQALPQCEKAKAGGPEDVVRALHDQYPWKGDKIIINEPRDVLLKYFDEELAGVIVKHREDRAARGEGYEEMPNVVINREMNFSQKLAGFQVCSMALPSKTINVQFRDEGVPRIVTYRMVETAAGWRIADILSRDVKARGDSDGQHDWSMAQAFAGK